MGLFVVFMVSFALSKLSLIEIVVFSSSWVLLSVMTFFCLFINMFQVEMSNVLCCNQVKKLDTASDAIVKNPLKLAHLFSELTFFFLMSMSIFCFSFLRRITQFY